jgi:hypothetical protein
MCMCVTEVALCNLLVDMQVLVHTGYVYVCVMTGTVLETFLGGGHTSSSYYRCVCVCV